MKEITKEITEEDLDKARREALQKAEHQIYTDLAQAYTQQQVLLASQ